METPRQPHRLLSILEKPVSCSQEETVAVMVLPQELVLLMFAVRAPDLTISFQLMSKASGKSVN